MKKVLDIALCVRYQDTIAFEEALNNAKGLDAIAAIYESTELEGYAEFASSN